MPLVELDVFICPRCAQICVHPLEVYFQWCPSCKTVTGMPQPSHPAPVTSEEWRRIRDNQDDLLIAIRRKKPLPTKVLQALPPWRAVMMAEVGLMTGSDLQDGTFAQLKAEARHAGADGQLGDWWLKEP